MTYKFELAKRSDDEKLRKLLDNNPMPGPVSFTLETKPSFFNSLPIKGKSNKVFVAKKNNDIVGFGVLSNQTLFIKNKEKKMCYLSALRIDKNHRGKGILSKSMGFFKKLNKSQKNIYYTLIVDKNKLAKKIFLSKKQDFPTFHDLGHINTYILFLDEYRDKKTNALSNKLTIVEGNLSDSKIISNFMNKNGSSKNFFPKTNELQIEKNMSFYSKQYFLIYYKDNLAGVFSVWDQSKFKQIVIKSYSIFMNFYKKAYNFHASVFNKKKFPDVDNIFRYFYLCDFVIKDDDQQIFDELLKYILCYYSKKEFKEYYCIMFGLHEEDVFNSVLKKYKKVTYASSMYGVAWHDCTLFFKNLKKDKIYIDISKT